MQLISKFNKGFRSLLSIFDNNCKYAWVTPLKDKKGITIADYNTTINEIEKKITEHDHSNKYITTQEFDKLTSENFASRLAQANLAGKNGTDNLINKYSILNGPKYFFLQMDYKTIQCLLSTRHIDSIGNNTVNIELLGSTGMSEKELKIHTFQTLILLQR